MTSKNHIQEIGIMIQNLTFTDIEILAEFIESIRSYNEETGDYSKKSTRKVTPDVLIRAANGMND
jgi:hypothetical protein